MTTTTVTGALGRVTAVFEDANGSNLQMTDTYNAGSLTKVFECSASNTSFYGYDAMDRLTSITYNDGTPNAGYSYDPTNLLIQAKNGNVTNNYSAFDGDGRVLTSSVQMQGQTYSFSYQYDFDGDLIKDTYPSGRVMNMTYDIAKRPQTENGLKGGVTTNYVQSAGYFPDGQVQFWQYGSNLWSWQSVDKMLRPWQAWATQNNNRNNWMFYDYYGFDNNSSVISANEGFGTGVPFNSMTFVNDQYEYDGLKRLTKVTDTNYSRQYGWDEYGNMSLKQNAGVPLSGLTPYNNGTNPYNTATNHLPGTNYAYDARGMMTKIGAVTMAYDAEGNMKDNNDGGTGQNLTWIYDAEGQRAQKLVSGTANVLYVHDAFGQLAAEYNQSGITASCQTCYLTYDMLGTVRLVTNQSQAVVARHDYLPFAEEVFNGTAGRNGNFGAISNVTQGFTGQEADGGTATLDYFNARHLSGVLGTFVQPDPANAGADITRPQSWNAYAYVLGNPLGAVDPDGTNPAGDFFRNIDLAAYNFGSEFASLFGGCQADFCDNYAEKDHTNTFGSPATGGIAAGSGSGGTNSGSGGTYDTGSVFRSITYGFAFINLFSGPLKNSAEACLNKIEQSVRLNLKPTKLFNLGPTKGKGMSPDGMRGGAYNRDFFATGIAFGPIGTPGAVPGTICGRFPDGLHIPIPNAPGCPNLNDPTVFTGKPTTYNNLTGFQFTSHIDSGDANTPTGSFKHVFVDVLLGNVGFHHGC